MRVLIIGEIINRRRFTTIERSWYCYFGCRFKSSCWSWRSWSVWIYISSLIISYDLYLPQEQREYIDKVLATTYGKVILVLMTGCGAVDISKIE